MKALLLLWQLPQAILGLCVYFVLSHLNKYKGYFAFKSADYPGIIFWGHENFGGGLSLWPFIFLWKYTIPLARHEYGHTIQSKILGWFYLPVVGVHSVLGVLLKHLLHKDNEWYHKLPWEKWADKLGNNE